jgi:Zn-dependent protease with chaperone function
MPASYSYPKTPTNVSGDILKPSAEFKNEVWAVVRSIITFIVVFILLVLTAIALAIACGYAGIWLIETVHNFTVLIFGIGLMGLGVMVLFFLFKFVFKTTSIDRSNMIEINAKDQPLLFDFINQLARETQTPRPKHVYVSPDVNASVFYDSGFWSMLLPVRKNLNIGLGLVNSVNVSELKAVIAHEFGHFSQKSMKLGSYTYHVNHIIHDMLYDNRDYEETLEKWGNVSNIFSFFATLTGAVVEIIKEILQKLYANINERYSALSRQMEFHADAVAASVSGSAPLVTALYRFEVSQSCYQGVLNYYNAWVNESKKGLNLYEHHTHLMNVRADQYGLKINHGLLQIDSNVYQNLRKTRVQIKNQWASHPDTQDREKKLNELNIIADIITDSAWTLFSHPEKLQQEVTANLYEEVKFPKEPQMVDKKSFESIVIEDDQRFAVSKAYKGFYDSRNITVFDPVTVSQNGTVKASQLSDILTDELIRLPSRIEGLTMDIELLERIQDKSSDIKTFDFEGTKYNRADARTLVPKLKDELKQAYAVIEKADKDIFLLYNQKSQNAVSEYQQMLSDQEKTAEDSKLLRSMIKEASQLFTRQDLSQGSWSAITNNMHREGDMIKERMRAFLSDEKNASFYDEDEKNILQQFIADKRKYFFNVGCDAEAINLHQNALHVYLQSIQKINFLRKKKILDAQAIALA